MWGGGGGGGGLVLDFFNLRELLPRLDIKGPQVEGGLASPSVAPGPGHLHHPELVQHTEPAFQQGRQVISKHSESSRSTAVGKTRRR